MQFTHDGPSLFGYSQTQYTRDSVVCNSNTIVITALRWKQTGRIELRTDNKAKHFFWTPHKILDWAYNQIVVGGIRFFPFAIRIHSCVFLGGGWFGFCGIWSLLSFMTSSCKNDRERLRLHWTQFDYKTTHTQSIKYGWVVWFSFVLALFFMLWLCNILHWIRYTYFSALVLVFVLGGRGHWK